MPAARSQYAKESPPMKDMEEFGQEGEVLGLNCEQAGKKRMAGKRTADDGAVSEGAVSEEAVSPSERPSKRTKGVALGEPQVRTRRRRVGISPTSIRPVDQVSKDPQDVSSAKAKRPLRNLEKVENGLKSKKPTKLPDSERRSRRGKTVDSEQQNGVHDDKGFLEAKDTPRKILRSQGSKAPKTASISSSPELKTVDEDVDASRRRRRRRRRHKEDAEAQVDDKTKIKRRVRSLVNRIRQEQNLIDAYAGEGWKGNSSREKIRPEKELQRAEIQILRSKAAIREQLEELCKLGMGGSIQESAFDADGRLSHEEIFCGKCLSQEALPDNDIILCDGSCDRGFHQLCLDPPLATIDIPPGDEGWLCPVCDSKAECLSIINVYLGTEFQVEDRWQDIFSEAAAGGLSVAGGEDWPSEDSEDDDYDPEGKKAVGDVIIKKNEADSSNASSDGSSDSEASSGSGSGCTDNKSDVSVVNEDELDGEAKRMSVVNGQDNDLEVEQAHVSNFPSEDEGGVAVTGKRNRKPVDYKKLHDEMFGNVGADEDPHSDDEEWGPGARRRKEKAESSAGRLEKGRARSHNRIKPGETVRRNGKSYHRLSDSKAEILRREFASGNCFPKKQAKEKLAEELGISFRQISCWFKNARHLSSKRTSQPSLDTTTKTVAVANDNLEARGAAADEMGAANGLMVEKLDEVQMKLHYLRKALEVLKATRKTKTLESEVIDSNGVITKHINGKRILYMPVAEVVEKRSGDQLD